MNVLSLFDGISCGQLALQRANIKVDKYFASEIDKNAIKCCMNHFPNTIQLGDITKLDTKQLPKIDLLIGGSPCQGFSSAGKGLNFEDPRSKLFFDYVRILKEVKPKYFLLENVNMKKEWIDIISSYLGVKPIKINSNLVSAQNRNRLYWTNIPNVSQPENKNIVFKDIYEKNYDHRYRNIIISDLKILNKLKKDYNDKIRTILTRNLYGKYVPGIINDSGLRYLTILECERGQTLPDNYTNGFSLTNRIKMIGNGWTVDVITHIFKNLEGEFNVR